MRKSLVGEGEDGEWVDSASGKAFEVVNPATEEHLADVAWGEAEYFERAVRAARRAFADDSPWRTMSASARGRLILKISELIEDHADECATLEALDNGKPFSVAKAADVALAADVLAGHGLVAASGIEPPHYMGYAAW